MLLIILLSALFYNLAFLFSETLGFLSIISLFLIFVFLDNSKLSLRQTLFGGWIWGISVFSVHFFWLLPLLLNKINAGKVFAFFSYIFSIFYFSLTCCLWFIFTFFIFQKVRANQIIQCLIFWITSFGYFYFLANYSLWFFFRIEGYPFLNPLIPLFCFKPFVKALVICGLFLRGVSSPGYNLTQSNFEFIHLKPTKAVYNQDKNFTCIVYQIYNQLCTLNLWEKRKKERCIVIFAPESTFPFPLNLHEWVVNLWGSVLPSNSHLFLGSQIKMGQKLYQCVYWLNQCRIKKIYVKKHCVAFVEKLPQGYKKLEIIKRVFLSKIAQFSEGKKISQDEFFNLEDKILFIPQICSEFFFVTGINKIKEISKDKTESKQIFTVFFVNDSWFTDYFKDIMQNLAQLKALLSGVPLIYAGHYELKIFDDFA